MMRIVIVTEYYSIGMGHTENSLPKALARLGHEVHLISSNLNIYGNLPIYKDIYERYLGASEQPIGSFQIDGYTVHRLPYRLIGGYIFIEGLAKKIESLAPEILQFTSAVSLNICMLALRHKEFTYRIYSECHQHMSIVRPFLKKQQGEYFQKALYYLTRTLPGHFANRVIQKCYAISPDCMDVAHRFYGVPKNKIELLPLGTDTSLFQPIEREEQRNALRKEYGFTHNDIVCLYTGRFSNDKNPFLVARAVSLLQDEGLAFKGIFVGDGPQKESISAIKGITMLPFMKYSDLPKYYQLADIGIWPTQESMSMLDASSCGLPIIVSDRMGEIDRIDNNGLTYKEGDVYDLARTMEKMIDRSYRKVLGLRGREKMVAKYSWIGNAKKRIQDYTSN
jgi:glycosyltransferase involved in cell wall biosynthesis